MRYEIISTGSNGNGVVINDRILIDCGVSFKSVRPYMKKLDIVLLTHQHSDHFRASTVYALHRSRPTLRFCCCSWMVEPLSIAGVSPRAIDLIEAGQWYRLLGAMIYAFPLAHNVPNCGWLVYDNGQTAMYATDTGTMDGLSFKDLDLYLIEANHTEAELEARAAAKLEAGIYSYEAAAAVNHLSQERTLAWLAENMGQHSVYQFLHQHIDHGGNQDAEQNDKGVDPNI